MQFHQHSITTLARQGSIAHTCGVSIEYAANAATQEIAPGIFMRLPARCIVENSPSAGLDTLIEFDYQHERRQVHVVTVAVKSSRSQESITGTDLRAVRVAELTAQHLPALAFRYDGSAVQPDSVRIADLVAQGPASGDTMRLVADLYSYAHAVGLRPAKHVQDVLGLASATASRWIRRARDLRMLDELEGSVTSGHS